MSKGNPQIYEFANTVNPTKKKKNECRIFRSINCTRQNVSPYREISMRRLIRQSPSRILSLATMTRRILVQVNHFNEKKYDFRSEKSMFKIKL